MRWRGSLQHYCRSEQASDLKNSSPVSFMIVTVMPAFSVIVSLALPEASAALPVTERESVTFASSDFLHGVSGANFGLAMASMIQTDNNQTAPDRIPPPPPPSAVSITTYVFGGYGQIDISGTSYSNGQTVSLTSGSTYSISPSGVTSGHSFIQWEANSGLLGSVTSSLTSYTPEYNGNLVLVLQATSGSNWAGYVESTASGNSINSLEGSFVLPSFNSYVSGVYTAGTNQEQVGYWGGIGGFFGSDLWQGGIAWMINSSSSNPVLVAWWEAYPVNGPQYLWGETSYLGLTPGATISVLLSISASNDQSSITIGNPNWDGTGVGHSFSVTLNGFTPNLKSGEWILEAPGKVAPNVNPVTFTVSSSLNTYTNLAGPVYKVYAQYVWNFGAFTQYFVPTTITGDDQFTINYHT